MNTVSRKKYALALSMVKNVGPHTYKKIIDNNGGVAGFFQEGQANSRLLATKSAAHDLLPNASSLLHSYEQKNIAVIAYGDSTYPKRLAHIYNPPKVLYASNEGAHLEDRRMVAVVGTREATPYGKKFVKKLISELRPYGVTIVSGLAYGIDICAHQAALAEELPTVAVIGSGLDMIYPFPHTRYIDAINQNGCVVTEHTLGTKAEKHHFPIRNRIIAGLVDAVIVVEGGMKSGALLTAKHANDAGREVFALPGDIAHEKSKGCHHLIKNHQAHMITEAADIAYLMNWETSVRDQEVHQKTTIDSYLQGLDEKERNIIRILQQEERLDLDSLSAQSELSVEVLLPLMLQLAMKRCIDVLPGNQYKYCYSS